MTPHKLPWIIFNFLTFGWLARRLARSIKREEATKIFVQERTRISRLRSFRRRLHRAMIHQTIMQNPAVAGLPRRVRRRAMFNAANFAYRKERGLPEVYSKSQDRRLKRGHFDPRLLIPINVQREDVSQVPQVRAA
jgi:hypothetical protein